MVSYLESGSSALGLGLGSKDHLHIPRNGLWWRLVWIMVWWWWSPCKEVREWFRLYSSNCNGVAFNRKELSSRFWFGGVVFRYFSILCINMFERIICKSSVVLNGIYRDKILIFLVINPSSTNLERETTRTLGWRWGKGVGGGGMFIASPADMTRRAGWVPGIPFGLIFPK